MTSEYRHNGIRNIDTMHFFLSLLSRNYIQNKSAHRQPRARTQPTACGHHPPLQTQNHEHDLQHINKKTQCQFYTFSVSEIQNPTLHIQSLKQQVASFKNINIEITKISIDFSPNSRWIMKIMAAHICFIAYIRISM